MASSDPPPEWANRWWVLVTVGVGTFMSALDGSIVNTLLPVLARAFGASVAGIEWVTTVYLLVISGLLLSVGRAGDLYGHKRLYIGGFVLFVAGSALCGLAWSAQALIGLRAIQALGAAMLMATAPAILTRSFPANQRGRALGAQGTFTYLGLTAGPSLGGWLASAVGWRAVFYINVPVGAIAIVLAWRVIDRDHSAERGERFDVIGAMLFTAGLVALLVALNQGHAWGWTSAPVLVLLSYVLGPTPMDLRFWPGAVVMMLIATLTASLVTNSGRSAWFVGVLVLMVYLIFAMTLYLLPPAAR